MKTIEMLQVFPGLIVAWEEEIDEGLSSLPSDWEWEDELTD